ncbi:acyltransferase family protein [Sphingomonas echinoides]|jgi:peptidoglycan/LPS O-acetylase OafA/YrhL
MPHCAFAVTSISSTVIPSRGGATHSLTNLYFAFPHGEVGVALFFALSGFVIAPSLTTRPQKEHWARTFYRRRFGRIYPPYAITLLSCWAIVAGLGLTRHAGPDPLGYAAILGLGFMNGIVRDTPSPFNPPMWSLEVEAQFYILAPLIGVGLARVRAGPQRIVLLAVFAGLCVAASAMLDVRLGFDGRFRFGLLAHAHLFLIGMLLRERYHHPGRLAVRHTGYDTLFLASLAGMIFVGREITRVDTRFGGGWADVAAQAALSIVIIGTFLGGIHGPRASRLLANRWVGALGVMSFSIYLIHIVVMEALATILPRILPMTVTWQLYVVWILLLSGSATLAGMAFFLTVERPTLVSLPRTMLRQMLSPRREVG